MTVYGSFIECYEGNRSKIMSRSRKGRFLHLYHFEIKGDLALVPSLVRGLLKDISSPIKINLAFGYIIKTVADEQYTYYHPSNNNAFLANTKLIQTPEDERSLMASLEADNILEFVYNSTLESSWVVHAIVCFSVRVYIM